MVPGGALRGKPPIAAITLGAPRDPAMAGHSPGERRS